MPTLRVVHLRWNRQESADPDRKVYSTCAIQTTRWTDDPQAVTCQRCIARMELQPA